MPTISSLVTWLFLIAVATTDISPLNIYRYLLISDGLLLVAVLLACRQQRTTIVYAPRFIELLFVVYLLSTAFAFLRPINPGEGVMTWLHSAFLMLIYVPAATTLMVIRPDLRRVLLPTLLVSTTLQSAITVGAVAGGLNWQTGTRIAGAFGSTHVWPYAASVVAVAGLVVTKPWPVKAVAAGSLAVIAAAEMFRRSRMLWIASVLGAALFGFVQARNKVTAVLMTAAAGLALTSGYLLDLYPLAVQERIAALVQPGQTPDLVARVQVVRDLAGAFVSSPVIGLGIQQSAQYLSEAPVPPDVVAVHNVVMHAAVEGGITAALAISLLPLGIVLLWLAARRAHTGSGDRMLINWAGASLIAIYVAAQLTPALYEHSFYLLVAFLASFAWPTRRGNSSAKHGSSLAMIT